MCQKVLQAKGSMCVCEMLQSGSWFSYAECARVVCLYFVLDTKASFRCYKMDSHFAICRIQIDCRFDSIVNADTDHLFPFGWRSLCIMRARDRTGQSVPLFPPSVITLDLIPGAQSLQIPTEIVCRLSDLSASEDK